MSINTKEKDLKLFIYEILGKDFILSLHKIDISRTLFDGFLILFFYFFNFFNIIFIYQYYFTLFPLYLFVAALINAIIFNWMNVQCHEASHNLLFPNKKINDNFYNFFLGFFSLQDVDTYRLSHRYHHSDLHTSNDPDLKMYTEHRKYRNFFYCILKDLSGITAINRYKQIKNIKKLSNNHTKNKKIFFFKVVYQLLLILFLILFTNTHFGILIYAIVQVFPLLSIFPILVRIRTIVQHFDEELEKSNDNQNLWISRSTRSNMIEHLVFGARMDFHFEHHLFPRIPYYNINILNLKLISKNFFKDKNKNYITKNFFNFFKKIA